MPRFILIGLILLTASPAFATSPSTAQPTPAAHSTGDWDQFVQRRTARVQRVEEARQGPSGEIGLLASAVPRAGIGHQAHVKLNRWIHPNLSLGIQGVGGKSVDWARATTTVQGAHATIGFRTLTRVHLYGDLGVGSAVAVIAPPECTSAACPVSSSEGWQLSVATTMALRAQLGEHWVASLQRTSLTGSGWVSSAYGLGLSRRFGKRKTSSHAPAEQSLGPTAG